MALTSPHEPSMTTTKEQSGFTILDRSIDVIVEHPDRTASRRRTITPYVEKLHRFHGTSLLYETCRGLDLGPLTFATACIIFHRFYYTASLTDHDVWSVAMACTLLATKIEEDPKTLKAIIEEYADVYAKRLVLFGLDTLEEKIRSSAYISSLAATTAIPSVWKRSKTIQNKFGPVYKEWKEQLTKMEAVLLRQLGFTFYWISDSHPHKFILNFCKVLELGDNHKFTQRVWDYCNDSCRLDLSLRFLPEVIASSAILLAAKDFDISLPIKPLPWWQIFVGDKGRELVDAANAILGISSLQLGLETSDNDSGNDVYCDWLAASKGFLPSLVDHQEGEERKSFNDPDSFLWFCQKESYAREPNTTSANATDS